ncbi:hypothetical protein X942_5911 [Burkholderia pseudomallei MSHR5596]|nr:hypothetical protein X942_5911 [Burkholderia pseudomallei MSHR5596]
MQPQRTIARGRQGPAYRDRRSTAANLDLDLRRTWCDVGRFQLQRDKLRFHDAHRLPGSFGSISLFLRGNPASQHVGVQAVVQRHRRNRHIRLHRRADHLLLELLAVPAPPRRLHRVLLRLGLVHRVHLSIQNLDGHDPRPYRTLNQDVFAGRLRYGSSFALKRAQARWGRP